MHQKKGGALSDTARGTWSLPKSKLHINYLELKMAFLALKEVQDFWSDKIVLVVTGNTTVVDYINKEGGMRSCSLCALLWRIFKKQVARKPRHIPGWLNVVADKPAMGRSGHICLPTGSHRGQSGGEAARLPMQENHSDYPRLAQYALLLGSSGNVKLDPSVPAQPAQPVNTTF